MKRSRGNIFIQNVTINLFCLNIPRYRIRKCAHKAKNNILEMNEEHIRALNELILEVLVSPLALSVNLTDFQL